jgi:hypothetical protein
MDWKALIFPWYVGGRRARAIANCNSGLVLASGYLSTAPPVDYSFALDKPLHTVGVVLLLTGLAIVAFDAWGSRSAQPPPPPRYVAIPLGDGQSRSAREEIWTEAGAPGWRRPWSVKTVGALLAVLLLAVCGRIGIFYRVLKDVECSGPSAMVCASPSSSPCDVTDMGRHSSPSCSPSTTASAIPRSTSTPPGVLTTARGTRSNASSSLYTTAPRATSFPLCCSPSAAFWSSSRRAHSDLRTFVLSQIRQLPLFAPFNSLVSL